ncbi:MAG: serine/threonine protein kinase [Fuerstiella sp.]|nr:serine/threonine protein kinase [Fuerstiella sp.]MCP4854895.1 serine/threonine protein kinase [Fuerstiella sp.]
MSMFKKVFGDQPEKHEKIDLSKRFSLLSRVGQGSMSRVWRAEDAMNGRFVAIKILDKEKTDRFEARFAGLNKPTEADIALTLKHPNIVRTLECGWTLEDEMYLVMEYVEGSGLGLLVDLQSDQMRRYRLRYMIQIGEALSHFHANNWIHRDVCPRNILVTEDNQIKVIDFGLTIPDTPDFRKPGNRTGTANYLAPELIRRQSTDHRVDVFSYAVTCFEMYTKRHPWDAAMTLDAVQQHINLPPLQIIDLVPKLDPDIADIIMRGLESNPANRWQTVNEMVKALRGVEARLVRKTRELLIKQKQTAAHRKSNGKTAKGGTAGSTGSDSSKQKSRRAKDEDAANEVPQKNGDKATEPKVSSDAAVETQTKKKPSRTTSGKSGKSKSTKSKNGKKQTAGADNATAQNSGDESDDGLAVPDVAQKARSETAKPRTESPAAAEIDDTEEGDSDEVV